MGIDGVKLTHVTNKTLAHSSRFGCFQKQWLVGVSRTVGISWKIMKIWNWQSYPKSKKRNRSSIFFFFRVLVTLLVFIFHDWQLIFLPVGVGVRKEGWLMKGQYRLEECSLVQHSSAVLLQQCIINKRSIGLLCSPCILCLS